MDDGGREVSTYEVRASTELQLSYLHGTCDTTYGSRVHETSEAVVVDVDVRRDDGMEICNAMRKTDGPPGGAGLQQRGAPAAAERHPPGGCGRFTPRDLGSCHALDRERRRPVRGLQAAPGGLDL